MEKKILKILMYSTSGPVLNVETCVLNVGTRVLKPGKIPCTRTQRTTTLPIKVLTNSSLVCVTGPARSF